MKNYKEVDNLISAEITAGKSKADIAWDAALACVGWPYVFGGRGDYCTPSNRRSRYSEKHPTIKTACKNYDGSTTCTGCKWYPGDVRVRFFDCRGFTYWCLKQVGINLTGAGATSQWNTESNWEAKGTIDTLPSNLLVCLFVDKSGTKEHTGFGYKGETCEASSGVQHFTKTSKKWTHWALPAGLYGADTMVEVPTASVQTVNPTVKKGSKGVYVTALQTMLANRGYDLGKYGVDGDFGNATLTAVKAFQTDAGLTVDGIVGPKTWAALEGSQTVAEKYTVTICGLSKSEADKLVAGYTNASLIKE